MLIKMLDWILRHPLWVLMIAALVFFLPVLSGGTFYAFDALTRHPPWLADVPVNNRILTDPVNVFYIGHQYFQNAVASGVLPYWNHFLGGIPQAAYSASPFHLVLFSALPITAAHDLLLFIHVLGAGIGTFLYLRLFVGVLPALIGAVTWMFNGYLLVWLEFENAYMMGLTLPFILYFIEKWFRQRNLLNVLGCAIGLSLATCVGYAHLLIFQMLFIGAYVLVGILVRTQSQTQMLKLGSGPLLALFISCSTGALFYTTHLGMLDEGQRERSSYASFYEATGKLPPHYLVTYVFPDFFGSLKAEQNYVAFPPKPDPRHYEYSNYNEMNVYTGVIAFVLLIFGCAFALQSYVAIFFGSVFVVTLLMAFGTYVYYPFYEWVPGLGLSTPTRVLYLTGFAVAVLAAFGAERLRHGVPVGKGLALIAGLGLLTVGIAAFSQMEVVQESLLASYLEMYGVSWVNIRPVISAHFSWASIVIWKPLLLILVSLPMIAAMLFFSRHRDMLLGAMLLTLCVDLLYFGWSYNTVSSPEDAFPRTQGLNYLAQDKDLFRVGTHQTFLANSLVASGFEEVGGYASFYNPRYGELVTLANGQKGKLSSYLYVLEPAHPLFDLLNLKYMLMPAQIPLSAEGYNSVYDAELTIYENEDVLPRAFLVRSVLSVGSSSDALDVMVNSSRNDFLERIVVEGSPGVEAQPNRTDGTGAVKDIDATVDTAIDINGMTMSFDSPVNGYLFVSTNYHPMWQATVNAIPVKPIRANHAFMAIPVDKGQSNVVFEFKHRYLEIATWVSLFSWVLLLLSSALVFVKQRYST